MNKRIDELLECAADEGINVNYDSLSDLSNMSGPFIFLRDNGNFAVCWKISDKVRIEAELKGNGSCTVMGFNSTKTPMGYFKSDL